MNEPNSQLLALRILDLLQARAQWDRRPVGFTIDEIVATLFGRFPTSGRPKISDVRQGVRALGRRVYMHDGKVYLRGNTR
jgi:hypothetical protein